MAKQTVSLSLSDLAVTALANEKNKSDVVNQILEQLVREKTSLDIISQNLSEISYRRIIERGVEVYKAEALRYKTFKEYAASPAAPVNHGISRSLAIYQAIADSNARTFNELVSALTELGYNFDDLNNNTFPAVNAHPYYHQSIIVERATNNQYRVNRGGVIVEA